MAGKVGIAQVINYVNTTSGEAQGVRAFFGIGGGGVRVEHAAYPPVISHTTTETTTQLFLTETDDQEFITESS